MLGNRNDRGRVFSLPPESKVLPRQRPRGAASWLMVGGFVVLSSLSLGCGTMGAVKHQVTSIIEAPRKKEETKASVARLHERQGNLRKAEELYTELQKKHPKKAIYPHRLGNVYTRLGEVELADQHYQKALELDPQNATLLSDMGYAALLQNKLPEAEEAFTKALDRRPNDRLATNNLAITVGLQGRLEESLKLFRQVNDEAESLANLAYLHVQRGEAGLAMQRYSQSLSANPNNTKAATALAQLAEIQTKQTAMIAQRERQKQTPEEVATQVAATAARPARAALPQLGQQLQPSSETMAARTPVVTEDVLTVSAEERPATRQTPQAVMTIAEMPVAPLAEPPQRPTTQALAEEPDASVVGRIVLTNTETEEESVTPPATATIAPPVVEKKRRTPPTPPSLLNRPAPRPLAAPKGQESPGDEKPAQNSSARSMPLITPRSSHLMGLSSPDE